MVQEDVVDELLQLLLSGSPSDQASAASSVCELCCERRDYAQVRFPLFACLASQQENVWPSTVALFCQVSQALPL